tara:strand:- start:1586 stop:2197 length:612 start_codon:yes stop_codon:yes gene_type:complete
MHDRLLMRHKILQFTGLLLSLYLIIVSPISTILESTMVGHVLLQLPLLVTIGLFAADVVPAKLKNMIILINAGGIFGCISITFIFLVWMIPRWLDASLVYETVALAKYASLIVGGVLLRMSWPIAHPITRGLLQIEFIAMLLRLGWLYLISPERLCNSYLLSDQIWLGRGLLIIAFALCLTWLIPIFFGGSTSQVGDNSRCKG